MKKWNRLIDVDYHYCHRGQILDKVFSSLDDLKDDGEIVSFSMNTTMRRYAADDDDINNIDVLVVFPEDGSICLYYKIINNDGRIKIENRYEN